MTLAIDQLTIDRFFFPKKGNPSAALLAAEGFPQFTGSAKCSG
jgi:hypothetical protein